MIEIDVKTSFPSWSDITYEKYIGNEKYKTTKSCNGVTFDNEFDLWLNNGNEVIVVKDTMVVDLCYTLLYSQGNTYWYADIMGKHHRLVKFCMKNKTMTKKSWNMNDIDYRELQDIDYVLKSKKTDTLIIRTIKKQMLNAQHSMK